MTITGHHPRGPWRWLPPVFGLAFAVLGVSAACAQTAPNAAALQAPAQSVPPFPPPVPALPATSTPPVAAAPAGPALDLPTLLQAMEKQGIDPAAALRAAAAYSNAIGQNAFRRAPAY